MSKKQTRRSISVSGELYERLQAYCQANGKTGSGVVEDLLRSYLGMEERAPSLTKPPIPRVERAVAPTPPVAPPRVQQMKEIQAAKTREVTIVTPKLEANGNWEEVDGRKIAPTEEGAKKAGVALPDLASKIFTF